MIIAPDPMHPRTVAHISEVEPGVFVIEQMRFIPLREARCQARARDLAAHREPPKLVAPVAPTPDTAPRNEQRAA